MLFLSYLLLIFIFRLFPHFSLLQIEDALFLALPLSFCFRVLAKVAVYAGHKYNQEWRHELQLKELAGREFDQYIFEKMSRREMVLVTLESKKVYAGWPLEIPENENQKWLCLAPQWSGFRDNDSTIDIKIDYSAVLDTERLQTNRMLIQVEKIITVQPFDIQVFKQFNPDAPDGTSIRQS